MRDAYFGNIKNPMTIIMIFVGIVDLICTFALGNVPDNLKSTLVAFIILFPVGNGALFYGILYFRPQNFYGPRDFRSDASYLNARGSQKPTSDKPMAEEQAIKKELLSENTPQLQAPSLAVVAADDDNDGGKKKTWIWYMFNKEFEKASALLEAELANAKSEDEEIRFKVFLADVKLHQDFQAGVSEYEHLIEAYPKNVRPYWWLAYNYKINNLTEKSLATVEQGLTRAENPVSLFPIKAASLVLLGQIDSAISLLESSIENSPTEMELYTSLIDILKEAKPKEVELWYRKALTVSPQNEVILFAYASYLRDEHRENEALYHFQRLTNYYPNNQTYKGYLGNAYLVVGLYDKALEAYENANILAEEKESWIVSNIGNLYRTVGLYSKANTYLNKSISIDGSSEYAHARLSESLESQVEESKKEQELIQKGQQAFLKAESTTETEASKL